MNKDLDSSDMSFGGLFEGPSNEFALNDIFLRPSVRRSDKNKSVDAEKLIIFHRGQYGEQAGTLIVRHYVQKDSKCIQCRNCGIFFNIASFLMHCHDQYGKRSQCNATHLQLGLNNPTTKQKEVWNQFQKKIFVEKSSQTFGAAKNVQNLGMPLRRTKKLPDEYREQRSPVYLRTEKPNGYDRYNVDDISSSALNRHDLKYPISRQYRTSSELSLPDFLARSELSPRRDYNIFSSLGALDREDVGHNKPDWQNVDHILLNRSVNHGCQDTLFQSTPRNRYKWRETDCKVGGKTFNLPIKHPDSNQENTSRHTKDHRYCSPLKENTKNEEPCFENPEDQISRACVLLKKALNGISKNKDGSSNAWRTMYEEEREHRMRLEANVRDLQHELRTRKT